MGGRPAANVRVTELVTAISPGPSLEWPTYFVQGKIFDSSGQELSAGFLNESWSLKPDFWDAGAPSITSLEDGRFLVVWTSSDELLYGQIFSPTVQSMFQFQGI